MAESGKTDLAESSSNKRTASSPLADETTKKHHGENSDDDGDLLIYWEDQTVQENGDTETLEDPENPQRGKLDGIQNQTQTPSSVEAKIDKMLELYLTLDNKIQQINHSSQTRLTNLRNAHNRLAKRVISQQADIVERDIRLNDMASDLNQTKSDLAETRKELAQTKYMVGDLITTAGMLSSRIEYGEKVRLDQWTEIKEKKIILSGIPEAKGEDIKDVVVTNLRSVLTKSQEIQQNTEYKGRKFPTSPDSFGASSLDSTYRIGKFKKGAPPRNILVSFVKTDDRKLVLKAKNTIQMGTDVNFYINEDLSVDTRTHRASIKRLSKSANEVGLTASTSGDKLIVSGKSFTSDELDLVPNRVLRSCAQEKWVNGGLAFRGERSVFSNFYTKPFTVDGFRYLSVEQYFQYSKAVYFEDSNLARKIQTERNMRNG